MGIPEEDLGPQWLRDYGYTDFGDIEADIDAMREFAAKLAADVQGNYNTHLPQVSDSMLTSLPQPFADFPELVGFMEAHRQAQDATQSNVYNYSTGTQQMAGVAQEISEKYRGADAMARARVSDVTAAFDKVAATNPGAGTPATGTPSTGAGDH